MLLKSTKFIVFLPNKLSDCNNEHGSILIWRTTLWQRF